MTTVIPNGSISGVVLNDTTGDGVGDTPIENVSLSLYNDVDGDGLFTEGTDTLVSTTQTAADGSYTFDNLPAGNYVVVQTQPDGYTTVSDSDDVNDGANDTDINASTTDNTLAVSLTMGETLDSGNNFIETQLTFNVSGTVFYDADKLTDGTVDGVPFAPPTGLFAVLVDAEGNVIAVDQVNGKYDTNPGQYEFLDVPAGVEYQVILRAVEPAVGSVITTSSLPLSFFSTGENIGAGPGSDGTVDGESATFIVSADVTEVNFGLIYFKPSTIP